MSAFGHRAEWVKMPLVDVATLQRGYDLPLQDRTAGPHPIFAANGPVGLHGSAKCKGPGVVTGRSGTIGKVHFVEEDYWPLNTSLYVKDFHGNDPKWVYYMLQSFGLEQYSQGAGVPTLNRNLVHGEPVKVPPLEEQRRIAAILDQAETLRTQRRQALAHLNALTQSLFLDMFGHPLIESAGKRFVLMEQVCEKISDGTHHSPKIQPQGVPYITAKHLKVHGLDFFSDPWYVAEEDHQAIYARCDPKVGDVLYIKDGATTGLAAINEYEFPFSMLSSLALLRPKRNFITSHYLCHWLNSQEVKEKLIGEMAGAAIRRLTLSKIKAVQVPVPPLALQQTFATRIQAIEAIKATHRTALAQLDALFASLQQRAFAGEL